MRKVFMKQHYFVKAVLSIFTICLVLLCHPVIAQTDPDQDPLPIFKRNRHGNLIRVYYNEAKPDKCNKTVENLQLVRIIYDNDFGGELISDLLFADSKGRREKYFFGLLLTQFSQNDEIQFKRFLSRNKWYQVVGWRCNSGNNSIHSAISLKSIVHKRH